MFKLFKILGGRINVPEIREIPVTFGSDTPLAVGDVVVAKIDEGAASSYTQSVSYAKLGNQTEGAIVSLYCVVEAKTVAASTETKIKVFDITSDMVFEVPVSATIASFKVGIEYLLNSSGKIDATTSSSGTLAGRGANQSHHYRGVVLFDRNGATAADALALVTFPRDIA